MNCVYEFKHFNHRAWWASTCVSVGRFEPLKYRGDVFVVFGIGGSRC